MNRRTLLAGAGAATLGGLAGCLDDVTEYSASAYGVADDPREEADYDLNAIEAVTIEEDVGLGPLEETVVATNYSVEYEKTVEVPALGEQRAGVFVVFSSPQVSVVGQEFNPVADMDTDELVELVQDNYDGLDDVEHDEDGEVTILDETVTRSRFVGEAEFDGSSVEVDVHVTEAVEAGEDLVVTIGVYPQELRDQEESDTVTMIEGVDPAAADAADADGADDDGGDSDDGDDDGSDDDDGGDGDGGDDGDEDGDGDDEDDGIVGY